jgi:cholest-4-en-3-one 26-monooxygenase
MAAAESLSISPLIDPAHYAAHGYPHELWTRLRREDPVHRVEQNPEMPFWAITKHADIQMIGKQPEKFVNGPTLTIRTEPQPPDEGAFPKTLIQMDPPRHGLYRKIVSKRFTPGALKRWHGDIERIGREIVDGLLEIGDQGSVDFVEKVSAPLPIAVIAWLLGVPRSDWKLLFDWTNRTIGAGDPEYQQDGADSAATGRQAMIELFQYFAKLVEEKKKNPADDLVTLFATAEVDGEKLPPMDVLAYCLIIVIAGNETTRNATSGGMLALAQHPAELAKIQKNPALLPTAIEEILRWTSPIIHFARTATQDAEIRGKRIKKGEQLALYYPSANRDEDVFDDPFTFRVDRDPNRHLAFGIGEHFCAGAHVARLELEVAFKTLLPRLVDLELAGPVSRLHSNLVGGIKHLPIRYKLRPA